MKKCVPNEVGKDKILVANCGSLGSESLAGNGK